jgi:FkbM family methyltransferase
VLGWTCRRPQNQTSGQNLKSLPGGVLEGGATFLLWSFHFDHQILHYIRICAKSANHFAGLADCARRIPVAVLNNDSMDNIVTRLSRKATEICSWLRSTRSIIDFPAALIFSICRTRPPLGQGVIARFFRQAIPGLCIHPRALQGFSLPISPDNISEIMIYEEIFIKGTYNLSILPFRPTAVVDCGGFEGYFSLLARTHFPEAHLVAFEPNPSNFRVMCSNFARNGIKVCAHSQAVSNYSGSTRFSGAGFGGHLCHDKDAVGSVQVEVANLREVIVALSPHSLLLKLDVEGEEDKILPEIIEVLPRTCAFFFEWHHGLATFRKAEVLLKDAGFTVTECRVHGDSNGFVDAFALRV